VLAIQKTISSFFFHQGTLGIICLFEYFDTSEYIGSPTPSFVDFEPLSWTPAVLAFDVATQALTQTMIPVFVSSSLEEAE